MTTDQAEKCNKVIEEAHAMIVWTYQSLLRPPSQTDGRYEESMFVWNLHPTAREYMDGCTRALFDALMATRPDTPYSKVMH